MPPELLIFALSVAVAVGVEVQSRRSLERRHAALAREMREWRRECKCSAVKVTTWTDSTPAEGEAKP